MINDCTNGVKTKANSQKKTQRAVAENGLSFKECDDKHISISKAQIICKTCML